MSKKSAVERGTKRTCQACGSRFYDLNRDPITCPACQAVFQLSDQEKIAVAASIATERAAKKAKKPEFVAEEPVPVAEEVPPDVEAVEGAEAEPAAIEDEQETFLEQEDEDTDVSGFIEGGIEEGGEEEA
ncbi:MAG: TIGR02300 family protein [Hyphomicrobiaceae bacterium]|nr:MAG: TIGR02300 family protein [Hyphomicrobiaceae bacterium]